MNILDMGGIFWNIKIAKIFINSNMSYLGYK